MTEKSKFSKKKLHSYPESLIPAGVDCKPSTMCRFAPKFNEWLALVGTKVDDNPELENKSNNIIFEVFYIFIR